MAFIRSLPITSVGRQLQTPAIFPKQLARFASSGSRNLDKKSEQKLISSFHIPEVDTLPSDLKKFMTETQQKAKLVPNGFRAMSHRPEELRAFVNYFDAVMNGRENGNLTRADRELIVVAVSALNNCRYCIITHSALHRIFSKNKVLADQVSANWETADLDERQQAILKFAMHVALCRPLQDSHFDELYDCGLDREDAWDIGAVVAFFALANRMAVLTSVIPNEEFYTLGRMNKPKTS